MLIRPLEIIVNVFGLFIILVIHSWDEDEGNSYQLLFYLLMFGLICISYLFEGITLE